MWRRLEKVEKQASLTKLGGVTKTKKSSPYSDSLEPVWVVRSYPNMGMIEKKLEVLFGFFNTENLDFGTT